MPSPYLLISIAIDESDANAQAARTLARTRVALYTSEWLNDSTAVVRIPNNSELQKVVDDIIAINQTFDPAIECAMVLIPHGTSAAVTDPLANVAAVTQIMGVKPSGA